MNPSLLAVDVGNSAIKWGLFYQGELLDCCRLDSLDVNTWEKNWLPNFTSSVKSILLCGVVPDRLQKHYEWLMHKAIASKLRIITYLDLPIPINVDNPALIGIDRLVATYAALKLMQNNSPALVVDAGSAVTVDIGTMTEGFLGGAIMPGLRLMSLALHQNTAKLPEVSISSLGGEVAGRNTRDAISLGIASAFFGGVNCLIQKLLKQMGTHTELFFTGGDGLLLAQHCKYPDRFFPNLVLTGLSLLEKD